MRTQDTYSGCEEKGGSQEAGNEDRGDAHRSMRTQIYKYAKKKKKKQGPRTHTDVCGHKYISMRTQIYKYADTYIEVPKRMKVYRGPTTRSENPKTKPRRYGKATAPVYIYIYI